MSHGPSGTGSHATERQRSGSAGYCSGASEAIGIEEY